MSIWILHDDFVLNEEDQSLAYRGEPDKTPAPLRKGAIPAGLLQLLIYFVKHQGQYLSLQRLGSEAWSTEQAQVYVAPETVKKSISRLRAYLGDSGKAQRMIAVQRRLGYCLVAKCEPGYTLDAPVSTVARQPPHNVAGTEWSAAPFYLPALIADKTTGFVGREYIFQAIEAFLQENGSGYFVLTGDPGSGKSAFLARYVQQTGSIAHFNARSAGRTQASLYLESVCAQLMARYRLPYDPLPAAATRDGVFLAQLLDEVSAQRGREERVVIAVDALDEVDLTGHPSGTNVLFLPESLPQGVYFVLTQRRDPHPRPRFVVRAPQQSVDFRQYAVESRTDVETYIVQAMNDPKVQAWIATQQGLTPDAFITTLADKSGDNFMYLRYVLADMTQGPYQNVPLEHLPVGLENYYQDHWERMGMQARPLPRVKLYIIYVLSTVDYPIPRSLLAQCVQQDEITVQEVLDEWLSFLHVQTDQTSGYRGYSLYHSSFRDFLARRDIVQAARVRMDDIHARLADLWEDFPL